MASTVVGLFDDREDAQDAVKELVDEGISPAEISVVASNVHGQPAEVKVDEGGTLAGEGAAVGATTGMVAGGIIGALAGLGMGFVPFLGFMVAGPLAGALTGAAAGTISGGLLGALVGLGIPEDHAHAYAEGVRRGGVLLSVRVPDEMVDRCRDLLDDAGAVNIEERYEAYKASGFEGYNPNEPAYSERETASERAKYKAGASSGSYAYADSPDERRRS